MAADRSLIGVVVCGLVLATGCASGGASSSAVGGVEPTVQFTIRNESASPIEVFALWQSGRRTRLGSVLGVSTETFTTPLRAGGIWFEVEDTSRMSSAQRGRRPTNYLPIGPDDHLEVVTAFGAQIVSVRGLP